MSGTTSEAPDGPSARHVVVVGMMGSGKTTLGRGLADHLRRPLLDSDAEIERDRGCTGAEIVEREGVEALHDLEREVLLRALQTSPPAVVTAAASVVTDERTRRAVRRAFVIWLDAPVDALAARVATGAHRRPIDVPAAERLAATRREAFAEVADLRLDALRPAAELIAEVLAHVDTDR